MVGGTAPTVLAVSDEERGQIQLIDHVEDEPSEVVFGQPVPHRRRHQVELVSVDRQEVLSHEVSVSNGRFGSERGVGHPWRETGALRT